MSGSVKAVSDTREPLLCQDRLTLPDTGVGVSGQSVRLVSVDTSVEVSGSVGQCQGRVSECRARAQASGWTVVYTWVCRSLGSCRPEPLSPLKW